MVCIWKDQRTPALAIVARGDQINTIMPHKIYHVQSQSTPQTTYTIAKDENKHVCTCEHYKQTHRDCIHILAIKFQESLKNTPQDIFEETTTCDTCHSTNVMKFGLRKTERGNIQTYKCNKCGHRFTDNNGFKKRRNDPEKIALALDLYFRGLSVRKVSEHFQQVYNLNISHMTVYRWIADYSRLASEWMDRQNTPTSQRWHIDETVLDVNGEHLFLWNVLDSESRYLLATHVSKSRSLQDARRPIQKAKKATTDRPTEVLTDKLPTYRKAISKELGRYGVRGTQGHWNPHKKVPSIKAKNSNNRIERFHGTEKERTKVMRGFDNQNGCANLMEGFRVHYNLVKSHQALGCTPSEATGKTNLNGFKWLDIIQKSTS